MGKKSHFQKSAPFLHWTKFLKCKQWALWIIVGLFFGSVFATEGKAAALTYSNTALFTTVDGSGQVVQIPKFDPNLGTLTAVTCAISVDASAEISVFDGAFNPETEVEAVFFGAASAGAIVQCHANVSASATGTLPEGTIQSGQVTLTPSGNASGSQTMTQGFSNLIATTSGETTNFGVGRSFTHNVLSHTPGVVVIGSVLSASISVSATITYHYQPNQSQNVDLNLSLTDPSKILSQVAYNPQFVGNESLFDLVAGKATVVFLTASGTGINNPQDQTPVNLESLANGFTASNLEIVRADGSPMPITLGELASHSVDLQIYFKPEGLGSGALNFSLQATGVSDSNQTNNAQSVGVEIYETQGLGVGFFEITGCDAATICYQPPHAGAVQGLKDFNIPLIKKTFPIREENLTTTELGPFTGNAEAETVAVTNPTTGQVEMNVTLGLLEDLAKLSSQTHGLNIDRVVAFVDRSYIIRNIASPNHIPAGFSYIKGHLSSPLSPNLVRASLIRASTEESLNTQDSVIAHELGHGLGLTHAPLGLISFFDPISRISETGLSIMSTFDLRTPPFWLNQQEFETLFRAFTAPQLDPEVLVISGVIMNNGELANVHSKILPEGFVTPNAANAEFELKVKGTNSNTIADLQFAPSFSVQIETNEATSNNQVFQIEANPFSVAIPIDSQSASNISSIELLTDGLVKSEFDPLALILRTSIESLPLDAFDGRTEKIRKKQKGSALKTLSLFEKIMEKRERIEERQRRGRFKKFRRCGYGRFKFWPNKHTARQTLLLLKKEVRENVKTEFTATSPFESDKEQVINAILLELNRLESL